MTNDITDNERCKDCAYFLHLYDGFCDLKKIRTNPYICRCDYWTKERINGLSDVSFTDVLVESVQNTMIEVIDEMISDVMQLKSFSQCESMGIALNCLSKGIAPKSEEFYEYVSNCKTLWEQ